MAARQVQISRRVMKCEKLKLGNQYVIVCRANDRKKPKCSDCGSAKATKLCDFVVARTLGGQDMTCDKQLCDDHATMIGDKDYCYEHGQIMRAKARK
jgi:hypothetical protein